MTGARNAKRNARAANAPQNDNQLCCACPWPGRLRDASVYHSPVKFSRRTTSRSLRLIAFTTLLACVAAIAPNLARGQKARFRALYAKWFGAQ